MNENFSTLKLTVERKNILDGVYLKKIFVDMILS